MAASSTLVSRLTTGSQSITLTSSAQGGVDLDGYGGLHAFGGYPLDGSGAPYWAGWDIARSLQLVPGGGGGWEMDGYGGIHAFGGAPAIGGGPYWADWDIARSLVLYPNPTEPGSYQGYVLDGFGGVHPLNGAPPLAGAPYWPDWDVARGLVLSFDSAGVPTGGVTLDAFGGLHPFGAYPWGNLSLPYYSGKYVYQRLQQVGGVIYAVGVYGVVVPATSGASLSPSWAGYPDWGSWDIERDVVLGSSTGGTGTEPSSPDAVASYYMATGATYAVSGIPTYNAQSQNMNCEEASLQNALEHEGISTTQAQLLSLSGDNTSVPGIGPGYSGDPYQTFVGPPNGGATSGYEPGTYYPVIARTAEAGGGEVIASGQGITPNTLVEDILNNHPAVVWITSNWNPYSAQNIQQGADVVPWAGPHEHTVTVYGFSGNSFLVMNPWPTGGRYTGVTWIPMSTFDASYATFSDMAVVIN